MIPLHWRADDRCELYGKVGRIDAIDGFGVASIEFDDGSLSQAHTSELDLVKFAPIESCSATNKRRHPTRACADRNQRIVDPHRQCQVYRCGSCHGWHLGNPKGGRKSK